MATPEWLDELGETVAMGTRAFDGPLFWRDEDYERDLALKARLLAERHGEVFAALETDQVRTASQEVFTLTGGGDTGTLHPLDAAGRLVQEDLCILVLRDGAPHLDAASLCFPSFWRLEDKLGRPLAEVHTPVPQYADQLATKVEGFLRRLAPGRMVVRRNWSIHDDPSYFAPVPGPPKADLAVPDDLYLRSERQILRRLATPDTVLFTIRTQQVPLRMLATRPDVANRLASIIDDWPPEMRAYKGGHGAVAARVIGWQPVTEPLPITSMLSQILIALTVETDNEVEHGTQHFTSDHGWHGSYGPWLISYAMYANFLRFVPAEGIRMEELAASAGYTSPVHPAYHGMRRWKYVTYTPDIAGSSPKKKDADALVELTMVGKPAREAWADSLTEMQVRWSERGLDHALQAALIPVAQETERPLPEYLPNVGFDRRQPQLAHPVARSPIDLDLLGLLSQVLLAMTYDFEAHSALALGTVSGLLQPLTEEAVPTRDLYEISGVATKEWSSAMNQLAKAGLAIVGPMPAGRGKSIRLSPAGVAAKEEGAAVLRDVEAAWRKTCGPSLDKLRTELERVVDDAWSCTEPYPDCWRAKVRLPRRLAHHPIVSHRGGYPDGS